MRSTGWSALSPLFLLSNRSRRRCDEAQRAIFKNNGPWDQLGNRSEEFHWALSNDAGRMSDALEVYAATVRKLPAAERLRLAAMILADLTHLPPRDEYADAWSEEDLN